MITTVLLVKYEGGWREVALPAAVDQWGRREARLDLGGITDTAVVDRIGLALLELTSQPKRATVAAMAALDGSTPYVDFGKGDTITVDGDTFRVIGITVTEDEEGNPIYVPQLDDVVSTSAARLQRWITSLQDGGMRGRVSSSIPAKPTGPERQHPRILELAHFSGPPVAGRESARRAVPFPCRMTLITAVVTPLVPGPTGSDTSFAVAVDGTAVAGFTLDAGTERDGFEFTYDVSAANHVSVIPLEVGVNVALLSVAISATTV